jgi:hypothetical protein
VAAAAGPAVDEGASSGGSKPVVEAGPGWREEAAEDVASVVVIGVVVSALHPATVNTATATIGTRINGGFIRSERRRSDV